MVYLGQTRSSGWISTLNGYGFGECTTRSEYPPRRQPFFFDNGAFVDWQAGKPFQASKYEAALEKIRNDEQKRRPDFFVVPDLVTQGMASLRFSLSWAERLMEFGRPLYLVVQDGMTEAISSELARFAGIFVGGSVAWKWKTARQWVDFAHARKMPCHIGRAGTETTCRTARRIGADSVDSCTPLWSAENLKRFLRAFDDSQPDLIGRSA